MALSIEAIAILCYTAIALFLSLYFVPFKVVPRAWAKAVRTKGHPAQVALSSTLDEASGMIVAKIVIPKVPEELSQKQLEQIDAMLPDFEALDANMKALTDGFNGAIGVLETLSATVTDEHLQALIGEVLAKHRKAGNARGDGGGGAPTALEGAMEEVEWAAAHPEQAQALGMGHALIDQSAPVFNWDAKKVKQLHTQANDTAARGGDLVAFVNRLQTLSLGGAQGGSPEVRMLPGGSQGGVRPLGR